MSPNNTLEHPVVPRLIEAAGKITQSFGLGRNVGQIFAGLYFSSEPLSLDDLTRVLGISKGSASMGVRQLEQWGGLERVWIKGDRKDYYRARDTFGKIVKSAVVDSMGSKMQDAAGLLTEALAELDGDAAIPEGNGNSAFLRKRLTRIVGFEEKARKLWESAILRMLLK